jgi:hypothetical protein
MTAGGCQQANVGTQCVKEQGERCKNIKLFERFNTPTT